MRYDVIVVGAGSVGGTRMDIGAREVPAGDGPLPVRRHTHEACQSTQAAFYQACPDADFPHDPAMHHPDSTGVRVFPMNDPDGIGVSTELAYPRGDTYADTDPLGSRFTVILEKAVSADAIRNATTIMITERITAWIREGK